MEAPQTEPASSPSAEESSAQKQARLRRERREAKIKAGGSARLEKITSLSGRPVEPAPPLATALPAESLNPRSYDDPDEVDISNHTFTSHSSPSPRYGQDGPTQAELRQLLRAGPPPPNMASNPYVGQGMQSQGEMGSGGGDEDPMMRMLQQMMGGMAGGGMGGQAGADDGGGLPPGLTAMLGGGRGTDGAGSIQHLDAYGYIWKIVHALFAFSLGIYATTVTPFNGSRLSRSTNADAGNLPMQFFWVFATAELVLQSTRFFLERGKPNQSGILGTVAGFLPEPWKGYVGLVSRYSGIYTRLVEDAMAVVFILGVVAWWHGITG